MKFEFSGNVYLKTPDLAKASHFYASVLGLSLKGESPTSVELHGHEGLHLLLERGGQGGGAFLEFFVDDLTKARDLLVAQGCTILAWKGPGGACEVLDPFGLRFNVWEK